MIAVTNVLCASEDGTTSSAAFVAFWELLTGYPSAYHHTEAAARLREPPGTVGPGIRI